MPVIDSSVAVTDVHADDPADGRPEAGGGEPRAPMRRHGWRHPAGAGLLALVVGALAAVMFATHRSGHWWGDDWALYIRQAQGLLDGNPNRVLEENEFTVTMSRGSAFSPPLYPWGLPLILAPFIAVFGVDLDRLAIVPVLSACVFACCWFVLARRRLGYLPALVGVAAVTITPLLLSWTELIQSEWPFLATVGVALVVLDRIADSDALVGRSGRVAPLIAIGLLAAAAFTVRREGLAMVGAIGAAQLAALWSVGTPVFRLPRREVRDLGARLLLPHATFLAAVGLLQITLPSTVVPRYDGTSVTNAWTFRGRLVRNLGQVSGFQRPWDRDPTVLGSTGLGWAVLVLYVVLGVMGIVLAVLVHRRRDLHLAAYAVGAFLIGGSFRSPINRYVATVAPILMLLALATLTMILRRVAHRHVATAVVTAALAAIVIGNLANAKLRIEGAQRTEDAGAIEWGPTHPDAIAMFEAVEELSDPDDVVAGPKARALVLETGRMAVQVDDYRPIPDAVDPALIVVEQNQDRNTYALLEDSPGEYQLVWQNSRFSIYAPR
jgi:hypothetical protein